MMASKEGIIEIRDLGGKGWPLRPALFVKSQKKI